MKSLFLGFSIVVSITCLASELHPNFDLTLIRDWTQESRHEQTPPYVYTKERNNYKISYIAANHTVDLNNPLYVLINKIFSEQTPKIVVVEGIPSSLGINNTQIANSAESCANKSTKDQFICGEPLYTVRLAKSKGISYVGGEPDFDIILLQLKNSGYSHSDIVYFHVARNLFGMKRAGELSPINLEAMFLQQLQKYSTQNNSLDLKQFKLWFKHELKKDFSIDALINSDYAPFKTGHKLNQIAYSIDLVRESNILKTIEQSLKEYKNVLVVYGSGHFYRHYLVLENAFKAR